MKILGFTEENTACDLCGKTELKGTYAVEDDNGNIYYLGSSCIKNKYSLNQKEFKVKVKEGYNEALKAANEEYEASNEYKTSEPDNNFEFGTNEHEEIYKAQKVVIDAKKEKIQEIRNKYNLEKKHFNYHFRRFKI